MLVLQIVDVCVCVHVRVRVCVRLRVCYSLVSILCNCARENIALRTMANVIMLELLVSFQLALVATQ